MRFTVPQFQGPAIHDELRFDIRKALMQDNTREPVTFRNSNPPNSATDQTLGIIPSRHRTWRFDGALERSNLPLSGQRF